MKVLRHPAETRQVAIAAVYLSLLAAMYFVPQCRNILFFAAACFFSFLNGVVIHNHMHQGIFKSRRLNLWFRGVLSFGSLYPVTANVAALAPARAETAAFYFIGRRRPRAENTDSRQPIDADSS